MHIDQFWEIVDDVHERSDGDFDAKLELLSEVLTDLPLQEVLSFMSHFDSCMDRAFTWELWGAAYVIGGGCSDDGFNDFRSALISMGRSTFEKAMADPQSLADVDESFGNGQMEGYQYVAADVAKKKNNGKAPVHVGSGKTDPSGVIWDEEKVDSLYPRLKFKG